MTGPTRTSSACSASSAWLQTHRNEFLGERSGHGLEYNGNNLNSLFAQRSNLLSPGFWGMLRDILRFNKEAQRDLAELRIAAT